MCALFLARNRSQGRKGNMKMNLLREICVILLGLAILSGCMSLEERLASPDAQIRHVAEAELWNQAKTPGDQIAAIGRIGNPEYLNQIALTYDTPVAMAAFNKVKPDQYPTLATKAKSPSVRKAALEKISDVAGFVYVFSNSSDEKIKGGALEKISSPEVLEKLFAATDESAWRQRILQRLPAESFVRIQYSPDFIPFWRNISDEKTLAKIVRDGCKRMSDADLAELMRKINDEKILGQMCTEPKSEKEMMRSLTFEIESAKRRTRQMGPWLSQRLKEQQGRLAKLKDSLLYVGDHNLIRVINMIATPKVRHEYLVNFFSQRLDDMLGDKVDSLFEKGDSDSNTKNYGGGLHDLIPDAARQLMRHIGDDDILYQLACKANSFSIRYAAIEKIQESTLLVKLINEPFKSCPMNPKYGGYHVLSDSRDEAYAKSAFDLRLLALSKTDDAGAIKKFFDANDNIVLKKAAVERLREIGAMNADALIAYDKYDQYLFLMLDCLKDPRDAERVATHAKLKATRLCAARKLDAGTFLAIARKEASGITAQCPKNHLEMGGIYLGMDIADAFAVIATRFPEVKPRLEWPFEGKDQYPYVCEDEEGFFLLKANQKDFRVKQIVFISGMVRKISGFNQGNGTLEDLKKAVERKYGIIFGMDRLEDDKTVGVLVTIEGETLQYLMDDGWLRLEYSRDADKGRFGNKGRFLNQNTKGVSGDGVGDVSGGKSGSLGTLTRNGINLMRNQADGLRHTAEAIDALKKGNIGGALKSGSKAMEKNLETIKDASRVLDSSATILEGVVK